MSSATSDRTVVARMVAGIIVSPLPLVMVGWMAVNEWNSLLGSILFVVLEVPALCFLAITVSDFRRLRIFRHVKRQRVGAVVIIIGSSLTKIRSNLEEGLPLNESNAAVGRAMAIALRPHICEVWIGKHREPHLVINTEISQAREVRAVSITDQDFPDRMQRLWHKPRILLNGIDPMTRKVLPEELKPATP